MRWKSTNKIKHCFFLSKIYAIYYTYLPLPDNNVTARCDLVSITLIHVFKSHSTDSRHYPVACVRVRVCLGAGCESLCAWVHLIRVVESILIQWVCDRRLFYLFIVCQYPCQVRFIVVSLLLSKAMHLSYDVACLDWVMLLKLVVLISLLRIHVASIFAFGSYIYVSCNTCWIWE